MMGLINLKRINDLYNHIRKTYKDPKLLNTSKWWIDLFRKAKKVDEVKMLAGLLKGKGSYLVAIAIGAVTTLYSLGMIDEATYKTILGLLNGIGVATIRRAIG